MLLQDKASSIIQEHKFNYLNVIIETLKDPNVNCT